MLLVMKTCVIDANLYMYLYLLLLCLHDCGQKFCIGLNKSKTIVCGKWRRETPCSPPDFWKGKRLICSLEFFQSLAGNFFVYIKLAICSCTYPRKRVKSSENSLFCLRLWCGHSCRHALLRWCNFITLAVTILMQNFNCTNLPA